MAKVILARRLAEQVVSKVRTPAIPYVLGGRSDKGTDCINLIGWCMDELGGRKVSRGSNKAWREDMDWTGTLKEAESQGKLIPGALLYMDYGNGAMDHAGVFVGDGYRLVTPDGKPGTVVHASSSRQGVYPSTIKNGWTHVAWLKGVEYGSEDTVSAGADHRDAFGDVGAGGTVGAALPVVEPGEGEAKVITTTSGLNLRKQPDVKSAPIKEMPIGTIVKVLGVADDWANVRWDVKPGLWHIGWCRIGQDGVDYLRFG